jgi:hypothetical protein
MLFRTNPWPIAAAAIALAPLAGCANQKIEPEIASPASHASYAADYPQALADATTGFAQSQAQAQKEMTDASALPTKLKDPGWARVKEIVQRADEAGKNAAYVERMRRVEGAYEFFAAEKTEITRKVAGSAQYVAKQKGCDVDVSGAVSTSLKESVDKQLEKELRDSNEAQHLVDRYRTALGKENAAALETAADGVSRASYLVHVQLVEEKLKVRRMAAEASDVKRTADDFIEAEKAFQADKKITPAEKKASDDRIAEMNKSKAAVDAAVKQAADLDPKMEEQIQAAQKQYDDALAALLQKIDEKAKSEPKAP